MSVKVLHVQTVLCILSIMCHTILTLFLSFSCNSEKKKKSEERNVNSNLQEINLLCVINSILKKDRPSTIYKI